MVNLKLKTVHFVLADEAKKFLTACQEFMAKAVPPSFVGVKTLQFRLEIQPAEGKDAYDLVCDTNKKLNTGSSLRVRDLVNGFVNGWLAKQGPFDVVLGDESLQYNVGEEVKATESSVYKTGTKLRIAERWMENGYAYYKDQSGVVHRHKDIQR